METQKTAALVRRLRQKRDLLAAQDPGHEKIRTLLMVSGGGMRGTYGAGVAIGLHHLGLGDCFDVVAGISTGGPICAYFLAGREQTHIGTTVYYEECCNGFVKRMLPIPVVDIDFLEAVVRTGRKKLDLDALAKQRSRFLVGVTNWNTAQSELLDAKRAVPDAISAIKASLALTFAYRKSVIVNGEHYTDGGMVDPLPIEKAVRQFAPTDVLIVSNYSHGESATMGQSRIEKFLDMFLANRMPVQLQKPFSTRYLRWRKSMQYARRLSCNKGILWGPKGVNLLTRDLKKLRAATEKGIRDILTLFGDSTPPETLMP